MLTSLRDENSHKKMNTIDISNSDLYNFVGGIFDKPANIPSKVAWELENEAMGLNWPNKYIIGSESSLIKRFDVSRESIREAIRILERRGSMKMLRGRYGGLCLLQPDIQIIAASIVSYLQICDYSRRHIIEAAHIFDQKLIQWLIKHNISISKPLRKMTFRTQLATACNESVFLLYATTLDLISESECNNTKIILETRKIEQLLYESIQRKDQKESERLSKLLPINIIESSKLDIINNENLISNAARVAIKIANHSRSCVNSENLYHSEWDLCEVLDERRSLIRQGLRILQDADMLESKVGRTGGFILKQPTPAGVIRQVLPILASERKNIGSLSSLIWELNLAQLELAIVALENYTQEKRELLCRPILSQLNKIDEPKRWILLQQKIGEISNNPLLDTILRCVVNYLTRRGQVGTPYPESISIPLFKHETLIVEALMAANLKSAVIHQKAAQDLLMTLKLDKLQ